MFLAFQIAQAVTAHLSSSILLNLDCICLDRRKKSHGSLLHFCVFPLNRAQTFLAKGHVHSKWLTVSGCCLHNSHVGSSFTCRRCKLSRVGRQLEQVLHMKFRTFGGTLTVHISFHVVPCVRAAECSALGWSCRRKATWYAVLTVNCCALFSFQITESPEFKLSSGMDRISVQVRWAKVECIFPRSHCLVSWSIRSQTRMFSKGSFKGTGEWDSHLWVKRLRFFCHFQPSTVILLWWFPLLPEDCARQRMGCCLAQPP